ncbi:LysR family transcriptional regulator [Roseococcus sp. YIM B11640]|uniref:LysR family transcriptional regulator n=1 Tax=Roseococcus sp. YIM B11640 TaxID=3133973 RepID=UPI003C79A48C
MSGANQLSRLTYFVAVVDARSFTGAAEKLGVSKAVVSQQVAKLEASLGTTLLSRTTRRTEPTAAGLAFHARCVEILRQAEEAVAELADANHELGGTLRLTASFAYGTAVVAPLLAQFRRLHPRVTPDLVLSDDRLDLIEHRLDLALRLGDVTGQGQVVRHIGTFEQYLVAAPFLAEGTPAGLEGVQELPWVANLALRWPQQWQLRRADGSERILAPRPAVLVNSTLAVMGAVLAGAGVSVLPDYVVEPELAAGRLVRLAPEWRLPGSTINAVFPPARFRPASVRAFVDMLAARAKG